MRDYYDCEEPSKKEKNDEIPEIFPALNQSVEESHEIDDSQEEAKPQPPKQPSMRRFADESPRPRPTMRRFADEEHTSIPQPTERGASSNFAILAFTLSIFSIIGCCCCSMTNMPFFVLIFQTLSITLAILSKQGKPFEPMALLAIIISCITLFFTILLTIMQFYLMAHPELMQTYLRDYIRLLKESGLSDSELDVFRELFEQMGIDPKQMGLWIRLLIH